MVKIKKIFIGDNNQLQELVFPNQTSNNYGSSSGNISVSENFSASIINKNYDSIKNYDNSDRIFEKTSDNGLKVKKDVEIILNGNAIILEKDKPVSIPSSMITGEDYAIFVDESGNLSAIADSITQPASLTSGVKIGGFHNAVLPFGTTLDTGGFNTTSSNPLNSKIWTQAEVDDICGINKHSIWDLNFRPTCDPRGMTCITNSFGVPKFWADIYFCSVDYYKNGSSRYNTNVASGTVLPLRSKNFGGDGTSKYTTFNWYEANEIAYEVGKRLPTYEEFCHLAFGVTEAISLGGSNVTIPATGHENGYTSQWGIEQATGHHYIWGADNSGYGSNWTSGRLRGQVYCSADQVPAFGGFRNNTSNSGSRCCIWNAIPVLSNWNLGARFVCFNINA